MTKVKICGLTEPETLTAAITAGCDFVGLVFYPPSPRFVDATLARYLCQYIPNTIQKVGLFVNPSLQEIETILNDVPLSMIQLHGQETPEIIQAIKEGFSLPIIKALSIGNKEDVAAIPLYKDAIDWYLCDAKGHTLPGGNGITFDWSLLKDIAFPKPWMLAGGLTSQTVRAALTILNPDGVDVSSGVENRPGQKDKDKILSFLQAVKQA